MNPQNFNNKLSEIYNSLDGKDLSEARMRKEDVWAKVKTKDKEKSKKPILLLLLLGGAALLAYLLFGNNKVNNEKPLPKIEKVDSSKNLLAHSQEQVKLNQRLLFEKGQSLDSLNIIHKELESNYKKLLQEIALKEQTLISQSVIKDTIYVKEIKTQEMVVEKVIRDTIIIEVPHQLAEPELLTENNSDQNKESTVEHVFPSSNKAPSSVQFNFSDSNKH